MPLSIRNVVSLIPISYFGFQLNTSLRLLKTWTRYVLLVLVFILAYVDLCSLINRLYGLTFLTPEVPKAVCSGHITDDHQCSSQRCLNPQGKCAKCFPKAFCPETVMD